MLRTSSFVVIFISKIALITGEWLYECIQPGSTYIMLNTCTYMKLALLVICIKLLMFVLALLCNCIHTEKTHILFYSYLLE